MCGKNIWKRDKCLFIFKFQKVILTIEFYLYAKILDVKINYSSFCTLLLKKSLNLAHPR